MKTYSFLGAIGFALGACSLPNAPQSLEKDTVSAAETHRFQFETVNVTGPVWSFERSGQFLEYGGPVGLIHHNESHDVIAITGVHINLQSAADVAQVSAPQIRDLISDAEVFCEQAGHRPTHADVVGLHSQQRQLYLIGSCTHR